MMMSLGYKKTATIVRNGDAKSACRSKPTVKGTLEHPHSHQVALWSILTAILSRFQTIF
jgi:hypothetical protein